MMEKKMETTKGYIGIIGITQGIYWDNGKEDGNHYLGFRVSGFLSFRF